MAILTILQYPNPRLNTIAEKVDTFDQALQNIIDDMFETLYSHDNCVGLAATQLDIKNPKSITVIDCSSEKNQPLCLVNPKIIKQSGKQTGEEGCMSVRGIYEKITRAEHITVRAFDRHGKPIEFDASAFNARCIAHEVDHLRGALILKHLSALKRERIVERLKKAHGT